MHAFVAEIRHGIRALAARPSVTLVLVLAIGLGIGAATTVYGFVYALLLRPYPYPSSEALVRVESVYTREGNARRGMSLLDVQDYRRSTRALAGIGAYTVFDTQLLTDGSPVIVSTSPLDAEALALLGVSPVLGRLFTPDEDRPGGDVNKTVISYQLWRSQFGGDPDVIGRPLRTDRLTYTIVGVMPSGFAFPARVSAWMPMESWYENLPADDERRHKWRGARWYDTVARLAPGRTLADASTEINGLAQGLERAFPRENGGVSVALTPLRDFEMGAIRPYLLVCLAAVALVLLIGCANVANLLLARTTERRREIAVQAALGASRGRIARDLLIESLVLGIAGAVCGAGIGWLGVHGLLALIPVDLPRWVCIEIDGSVLAMTALLGVVTAMLFGLAPMIAGSRLDLTSSLRDGARGSTRSPVRAALVVSEIALSVLLLVAAGLLMQTFFELQQRPPGFQPEGLVAARVVLWAPGSRETSAATLSGIHTRVLAALRALPGVRTAAVSNYLPYSSARTERGQAGIFIKGRAAQDMKTLAPVIGGDVSPDYFATMRIPLIRGRLFEPTDTPASAPVVVISERAAELFWPNEDPIGQEMSWGQVTTASPWTRVVGIVGNIRDSAAEGDAGVELYYPLTQWPVATSYYLVRTDRVAESFFGTIRRTILGAEPAIEVSWVKPVEQTMTESLCQRRLWGVMFSAFAGLALVLAAVGVYGVISYATAQRTREMGVRMALGAEPGAVRRLVLREGLLLCAIGVAIGVAAALGAGRLSASLLFGVTPEDPRIYGTVVAVIVGTVLLACWVPARRASRVNPIVALRTD